MNRFRRPLRIGIAAALAGLLLTRPRLRHRAFSLAAWRRAMLIGGALLLAKPQEHRHVTG
jgi:hypothetical protein